MNVYGNGKGWTTDPPTVEGLYRAINRDGFAYWVAVHQYEGKYLVSRMGYGHDITLDNYTHWLGPLPIPEPPR
jgi:hypothetical protein